MEDIKNVIICGLGAVGSIYAEKINNAIPQNLKILVDKERFKRYSKNPIIFNGKELNLNYILPDEKNFNADLIIIATKFDGIYEATKNIENFVNENTIILSLLNGISSEKIIADKYGWEKVLLSYFIGHSAMREGRFITHDGTGEIIFGAKTKDKTKQQKVQNFFDKLGINYQIPDDIEHSLWLKYMMNVSTNQPSAILRMTFGEMNANKNFIELAKKLMYEVQMIAKAEGVNNTEIMINEALEAITKMLPEGKTSMLQDVLSGRKTEVDMFAGTIIELGKKHNIEVPYNKFIYEMFMILHEKFYLKSIVSK